jgi:predicted flap endonuclease-1-like 5' DNA nuclease
MTAEEINATAEQAPKPASRGSQKATGAEIEGDRPFGEAQGSEPVEQDVSQPIDYVTAQEVNTEDALAEGDDFLRIKGIGPTYARRLKDAGYVTFANLAAATPEEVGAAIGWPVDRVLRSEVIDQARVLARG